MRLEHRVVAITGSGAGLGRECALLFAAEGWRTYTADPERPCRALVSPGSTTLVALEDSPSSPWSSGSRTARSRPTSRRSRWAEAWRGVGLGRGMLREALRLGASPSPGFRLTRDDLSL